MKDAPHPSQIGGLGRPTLTSKASTATLLSLKLKLLWQPAGASLSGTKARRRQWSSCSLPDKFKVRVLEDSQATITILLTEASGTMRRTERRQKVSFAWLRQQFGFGHFRMLNADAREQVADRFPKPLTDRTKSQRALRLIARRGRLPHV